MYPGRPVRNFPTVQPFWKFSWEGLEDKKAELERLAHAVINIDALVRNQHPSSVATGLICQGIMHPEQVEDSSIKNASDAHKQLGEFSEDLVFNYHLHEDFVYSVWAPILNPYPEEVEFCAKIIANAKIEESKRKKFAKI